ncbi:FtsX-like permease family protein [Salicibibacter cibarius]|uniref:FtsX-like permease family protein n=2 Tax=Salicibibacter cibarius TaxID=2743000 RepID=A0A7T6Z0W5_9BACI|nr:FtsX-like permease family protein [Salicibibacter cibarius]
MRAVGFTSKQVRTMIITEGLIIGFTGAIGGILLGTLFLGVTSYSEALGDFISFHIPVRNSIITVTTGLLLSMIASWFASNQAVKQRITNSLNKG